MKTVKEIQKGVQEHLPHTKEIVCAFCRGTGKDPFDLLYSGSTCQVCNGRKNIFVREPFKNCSYCRGSGVEFNTQNTCIACHGRGVQSLNKKENYNGTICIRCSGTGMTKETSLPCLKCHGMGNLFPS